MSVKSADVGLVEPGTLYRLEEVMKRMGWGRHAADQARRRGLKATRFGKRVYVKGSDVLDFIDRVGVSAPPPVAPSAS